MIRLVSDETVVREFLESDAAELAVQANDRTVWENVRDLFPHPYSLDDARQFIAHARSLDPPTHLAIEVDGHESAVDVIREQVDGSEEHLATLHVGNYVGELGPLLGFPRSATVRARSAAQLTPLTVQDSKLQGLDRATGN